MKGCKTGGRQKGSVNKITRAFKDAVRIVYDDIGGHTAFAAWAREHPTEFYRIAARLIPVEVKTEEHNRVTVIVQNPAGIESLSVNRKPALTVLPGHAEA